MRGLNNHISRLFASFDKRKVEYSVHVINQTSEDDPIQFRSHLVFNKWFNYSEHYVDVDFYLDFERTDIYIRPVYMEAPILFYSFKKVNEYTKFIIQLFDEDGEDMGEYIYNSIDKLVNGEEIELYGSSRNTEQVERHLEII